MSLTTETIGDLVQKPNFMNRRAKKRGFTQGGMKGTTKLHSRKGTEQKKGIYDNASVSHEKGRATTRLRRKARRADKDNTTGSTRVGNVKLTTLRKSHKLNRREWKLVEAAPLHPGMLEETTIEEVRWKGKNKLGGRTSKHGDCDQH
jgi:hypothetical protein